MKAQFNHLDSVEQLEEVFTESNETPQFIFKHSLTCPISADVYQEIKNVDGTVNLIVVQTARDVSSEVAAKTGLRHESPQAIVLEHGKPVYHAAHYDISADDVNAKLNNSNGKRKMENGK
ncbi:MAG: bacillithiol system redox-active protein YtxJ [Pyrinomonadaceae bacterium]